MMGFLFIWVSHLRPCSLRRICKPIPSRIHGPGANGQLLLAHDPPKKRKKTAENPFPRSVAFLSRSVSGFMRVGSGSVLCKVVFKVRIFQAIV